MEWKTEDRRMRGGARKVVKSPSSKSGFKLEALPASRWARPSKIVHINNSLMTDKHLFAPSALPRAPVHGEPVCRLVAQWRSDQFTVRAGGQDEASRSRRTSPSPGRQCRRHAKAGHWHRSHMFGPFEKHNRDNMEAGRRPDADADGRPYRWAVDRLKEKAEGPRRTPNDGDRQAGRRIGSRPTWPARCSRAAPTSDIDDAYKMQRTVDALVDLGRQAIDRLDDKALLMSKSDNCKAAGSHRHGRRRTKAERSSPTGARCVEQKFTPRTRPRQRS